MSQVLVASPTSPTMTIAFNKPAPAAQLSPSPTQLASVDVPPEERILVSQLSHLASQHHTSEYNKLKFGPGGCPSAYVPLSIFAPQRVRWVAARQLQTLNRHTWWPAERSTKSQHSTTAFSDGEPAKPVNGNDLPREFDFIEVPPPKTSLPSLNHPVTANLQEELSMAISSPLSIIDVTPPEQLNLIFTTKTSKSHPINISFIIPLELLPLISSHLAPAPPQTSYMFNLPPSLLLNYLVSQPLRPDTLPSYPLTRVYNNSLQLPTNGPGPPDTYHKPTPPINELPQFKVDPSPGNTQPAGPTQEVFPADSQLREGLFDRPHSAPPSLTPASQPKSIMEGLSMPPPVLKELISAMSSNIVTTPGKEIGKFTDPDFNFREKTQSRVVANYEFQSFAPVLGNLLLSSCPGKKVRLNGPVKGRGAICRDLDQDLQRIKSLGVGCIVCCLDDEELEYLGASWAKYCKTAHSVGLDIIRIPMPEGFAPTAPCLFDQQLSQVIHSYTLKGISVLVHCRGGVGRAGLVACCWLLKLGLCGWISDPEDQSSAYENGNIVKVRKDTLMMVERAISVVRRRRSVKAIETYEQVKFLVEFVEYMRSSGKRRL